MTRFLKFAERQHFEQKPFLLTTLSYLVTIGFSRLIVKAIELNMNIPLLGYDFIGDFHIHHFAYGILLLCCTTFYTLFFHKTRPAWFLFILYGVSLALIFDEFSIWIKLDPSYHQLSSTIAIVFIALILGSFSFIESRQPSNDKLVSKPK